MLDSRDESCIRPYEHQELESKVINARWFSSLISIIYFTFAVATVTTTATNGKAEGEAAKAFQFAERLQAEGKAQEAISAYEEILKRHPGTALKNDILIEMARSYNRLGDDDSAIRTYLKLISDNPDSTEASQAVSLMVNLYAQRYRFDEVIAMSRHLTQQFPETKVAAMALYRIAGYLYSQRKFQEAVREYENFIDQFPESTMRSTAFNRLISLYIREGMFEEAERRLMNVLAQNPKDSTYMLRQLALVYQKQSKYDRALDLYQRILVATPNDVDIYEQLGELYAERGDKERAVAEWSKITKSAPGQYSRHQMLAYILKSHGFHDQAAAEYRKAIDLQPTISYLYTQLADVYVVEKQFGSAIDIYLDALVRFPINHPNRSNITTTMLELCNLEGLCDEVISRLRAYLIQSPGNIPALLTLADVYFHQDNFDDSLQQFRILASLYPDKGELLFDRAEILERERQSDPAIKFYQTVLDLFPGSGISLHALMRIGQLKSRLQQPQAAITSLQRILDFRFAILDSGIQNLLLSAYILIGDIYLQQLHDVKGALSTYTEAKREMEASPNKTTVSYVQLHLRLAECYRLMGEYDTAENVLDSIQTKHQSRSITAQIAKSRGDCYFSRGDFDSALTQYQEAIRWVMNEDWVNDSLDKIALIKEYSDHGSAAALLRTHAQIEKLRKLGRYSEALALAEEEHSKGISTDRIQLEIGDLMVLQMKPVEAISAYEELIQSHSPLAPEAQFRIAGIYWQQLGKSKQAIGEYSVLIENYPDSILVADARKQIRQLASENTRDSSLP